MSPSVNSRFRVPLSVTVRPPGRLTGDRKNGPGTREVPTGTDLADMGLGQDTIDLGTEGVEGHPCVSVF